MLILTASMPFCPASTTWMRILMTRTRAPRALLTGRFGTRKYVLGGLKRTRDQHEEAWQSRALEVTDRGTRGMMRTKIRTSSSTPQAPYRMTGRRPCLACLGSFAMVDQHARRGSGSADVVREGLLDQATYRR